MCHAPIRAILLSLSVLVTTRRVVVLYFFHACVGLTLSLREPLLFWFLFVSLSFSVSVFCFRFCSLFPLVDFADVYHSCLCSVVVVACDPGTCTPLSLSLSLSRSDDTHTRTLLYY